jgi:hypothetical protein
MGSPEGRVRYIAAMQAALEVQKTNLLLATAPIVVLSTQIGWIQSSQSNFLKAMITLSVVMLILSAIISMIFVYSGHDYIAKTILESDGLDAKSSPYLGFIGDQYKIIGGLTEENLVSLGRRLHGPLAVLLCSGWALLVVSILVTIWTQPAAPQVH